MTRRTTVQIVAVLVLAVFAVGLWASGVAVEAEWLRFYSWAVFVAVAGLTIWEQWLWRLPWFQRFQAIPPNLQGTWKGVLASEWVDPETSKQIPAKDAYLVIRQSLTEVTVVLLTDESRSTSTFGRVLRTNEHSTLDYMYLNRPDQSLEHRSHMHHGSTSLDITGAPATRLRGRYWTSRDSKGELDLKARSKTLADDYDSAVQLFSK